MMNQNTPPPTPPSACLETRQRLLDAASAVFAEVGYHAATVREICQRAGANIAAVNYHFGDKEQLYLAVLRSGARLAEEKYPITSLLQADPKAPAEARLRILVRELLMRIFDPERVATHGKLMAREMIDPSPGLEILLEEIIRPVRNTMHGIVGELLGPEASEREIKHCSYSILGQCLHYHHCRPVLDRLDPEQTYEPEDIAQLAEHITRFSLCALHAMAQGPRPDAR